MRVTTPKTCPGFESREGGFFSSETKHDRKTAPKLNLVSVSCSYLHLNINLNATVTEF
jgi:hypothetical protein